MSKRAVSWLAIVAMWAVAPGHVLAKKTKPTKRKAPAARKQAPTKRTRPADRKAPAAKRKAPAARKAPAPKRPRPPKTKGERIVEAMVTASGGRTALNAVKTVQLKGVTKLITVLGARTAKIIAYELRPGYQRLDMTFGSQTITQSYHPKGGWMRQNGAVFQLPRSMVDMTNAEIARANLELRYALEPIKVTFLRTRKIRGKQCNVVVFVDAQKRRTTYYIDSTTKMLVKRSYVGPSPLGTGKKRFSTYYTLYRKIKLPKGKGEVSMPMQIENYIGGRKVGTIQIQKVKVNSPSITPQTFLQPSPVE